jgi:hypothetical protein
LRAFDQVAGLGYLGLLAILTWQALRGQSIIHPDSWTLLALGLDAALVGVGFRFSAAAPVPAAVLQ